MAHAYHKWIELSKDNLLHNISFLKNRIGKNVKFCSVVKSNAYGHGILEVARILRDFTDFLGVHEIGEAKILIDNGIDENPVLILGPVHPDDLDWAVRHDLHLTVYEKSAVDMLDSAAERAGRKAKMHLKMDTGTSRQGILPRELGSYARLIKNSPNIELTGLSMHFANIEDTLNHQYAYGQLSRFKSAIRELSKAGLSPDYIHSACTAAALLFPDTHFSMVRSGIGLYGLWPSRETYLSYQERYGADDRLKPVLSFKTSIVQVKDIPENTPVGYGCSFITSRKTRIGVLPVGYADGYLRAFGNRASVIVRKRYAKVIGRICMNLCMIDITDIPDAKLYDTVTLIGSDGDRAVSADDLARLANTINYEIVTLLNSSLKRIIV